MEQITIYVCENSIEGIFTGIYDTYLNKKDVDSTELIVGEGGNYRLFAEYQKVQTQEEKAKKVANTIIRDFGEETYLEICRALASEDEEKANAVYQTVACGLKMKNPRQVMGNLKNKYVQKVFELSRNTNNEILHLNGFLRFNELENHVMFSKIGPKNNILTFLAPHFANRLPLENFVIYDENRSLFVIHPAGKQWFLTTDENFDETIAQKYSDREKEYQELFKHFCHSISIKERENPRLQQQMLPLRFQKYMVEFGKYSNS